MSRASSAPVGPFTPKSVDVAVTSLGDADIIGMQDAIDRFRSDVEGQLSRLGADAPKASRQLAKLVATVKAELTPASSGEASVPDITPVRGLKMVAEQPSHHGLLYFLGLRRSGSRRANTRAPRQSSEMGIAVTPRSNYSRRASGLESCSSSMSSSTRSRPSRGASLRMPDRWPMSGTSTQARNSTQASHANAASSVSCSGNAL
jgi:hypothetical protein